MCGLGLCCTINGTCELGKVVNIESLRRRGPDVINLQTNRLSDKIVTQIVGCTLHLRGSHPVKQPVPAVDGSWLLWNGEIFSNQVSCGENDTRTLMGLLEKCTDVTSLLSTFSKLHGPWAFIFWQVASQKLWFGRDMFGRRSLLWKYVRSPQIGFALSSVANRPQAPVEGTPHHTNSENWFEVPAQGIYCLDLSSDDLQCDSPLLHPWSSLPKNYFKSRPDTLDETSNSDNPSSQVVVMPDCIEPPFPCGLNMSLPTPADLEMYSGALKWTSEKNSDHSDTYGRRNVFLTLEAYDFVEKVESFELILQLAVEVRVRTIPDRCQLCIRSLLSNGDFREGTHCISDLKSVPCQHSKIAVLFSGGLDSTVLARMVDRCLPDGESIDLLNVAFEQNSPEVSNFDVPDRISGRESFAELQALAPNRTWNFVEINVSKTELEREGEARICDLVYPLNSVLDNDIGCAIWFAARGKGAITVNGELQQYSTSARVVLTGMGADEQLAGYSRHRICFQRNGWPALLLELKMEMDRISSRNLGRDDRVISDHGREARFPFLDENVVLFLNSLPVWFKANLDLPRGVGDKVLLRCVADRLQLRSSTNLAKRAIQFGSRIAKIEKNRKGSDTCQKLLSKNYK